MKKIGVLFGQENTFPGALVERINSFEIDGVKAEFVQLGGVMMAEPCGYAVIVDRISHDMPFYRSYLKNATLTGTKVINNPFWWSADDKFFNYALAAKLGVAVPKTVLLPHKQFPPLINAQSLRNLEYPLKWDEIFDYVGFPAFLKPHDGGGWRDVFHVHDRGQFFGAYDQTRDLCMTLQAAVNFKEYFRCYVVGQEEVHIMAYDPRRPHEHRYVLEPQEYPEGLLARVEKDALTLCRALGYDLNTVEFAVQDGVPYAIDFMNPAPDADLRSVGKDNFEWIVEKVARLAVKKAAEYTGEPMSGLNWSGFLTVGAGRRHRRRRLRQRRLPRRRVCRRLSGRLWRRRWLRRRLLERRLDGTSPMMNREPCLCGCGGNTKGQVLALPSGTRLEEGIQGWRTVLADVG